MLLPCLVLTALLVVAQLLSLRRGQPCQPPRLLLALLHAGIALLSGRQELCPAGAGSPRAQDHGRSAILMGMLMLLILVLYPCSVLASVLQYAVSIAALIAYEITCCQAAGERDWVHCLVLLSLAVISTHTSMGSGRPLLHELLLPCFEQDVTEGYRCRPFKRRHSQLKPVSDGTQELLDAFKPILSVNEVNDSDYVPPVGTYLSYIVSKIIATGQRVDRLTCVDAELQQMTVKTLRTIARELGSTSTLQRLPDVALANTSSNIVNYVQTMLHPTSTGSLAGRQFSDTESTPGCSNTMRSVVPHMSYTSGGGESVFSVGEPWQSSYLEVIVAMAPTLNPVRAKGQTPPVLTVTQGEQLLAATGLELGSWHADLFQTFDTPGKWPLLVLGRAALQPQAQGLNIEQGKICSFLHAIEERYSLDNPYHSSLHAADVTNSLLYFLGLPTEPTSAWDELEKLTGLLVAAAHDVGHPGKANRYHIAAQTPLAQLFNDQSVLENMHCAVMFAVLRVEGSNLLEGMDSQSQALFRSLGVRMILNTDLAKHVHAVSQFRQDFIDGLSGTTRELSSARRQDFLCYLLKCSDVGGSAKPFGLHIQWTMRICSEFYAQGDAERALGLPCSPFCGRNETSLRECQKGFFDFVVYPTFSSLDECLQSQRLQFEVLNQMNSNRQFWHQFDDVGVDHSNLMANVPKLQYAFLRMNQTTTHSLSPALRRGKCDVEKSKSLTNLTAA